MTQQYFKLHINENTYEFKTKTFAKVSKRAGQLIKNAIYEDSITTEASEDTIEAFVAACNLQQFKVTNAIAFELLDLAIEYKVANLEKFVRDYINTKKLKRQETEDNNDYLQIFLNKMVDRSLEQNDYMNVAKRINKYISDERMFQIYLIPLFRLILMTDYTGCDPVKLNKFVLRMLNEKPDTAVPLLLRIDCSTLTKEQDDSIFGTDEVHQNNSNYFTALSLSADRNHQVRSVSAVEKDMEKKINDLDTDFHNLRRDTVDELESDFTREYNELKRMADKQKAQIERLKQEREKRKLAGERVAKNFGNNTRKTAANSAKIKENINQRVAANEELQRQIAREVKKKVGEVKERVIDDINSAKNDGVTERDLTIEKQEEGRDRLLKNIDRMQKNCQTLENAVNQATEETDLLKSTLAAKMVRDFMRFDNFIRRNEKKFAIFKQEDIWGLTPKNVENADNNLKAIERRIDKICPIRHGVQNKK